MFGFVLCHTLKLPTWITSKRISSTTASDQSHCVVIFSNFSHFSFFFALTYERRAEIAFPGTDISHYFFRRTVWSPRTKSGPVTGLSNIGILYRRVQNFRNLGGANLFIFWNVCVSYLKMWQFFEFQKFINTLEIVLCCL